MARIQNETRQCGCTVVQQTIGQGSREVRMKKYVLWGLASIGVISLWIFSVVAFVFYCLGSAMR